MRPAPDARGKVELSVKRDGEAPKHYVLDFGTDSVAIEERAAPEAEARIAGSVDDWVAALGPDGSRSHLTMTGDRALAEALLDALTTVAGETTASAVVA